MNIQELQIKYINGEISYNQYLEQIEQIRNNENSKPKNNSWYYIVGIGCLFLLGTYFSKKR